MHRHVVSSLQGVEYGIVADSAVLAVAHIDGNSIMDSIRVRTPDSIPTFVR